jgi:hypothetical protein
MRILSAPSWLALSGFKKRYKLPAKSENNKKHLPIIERVPVI